MAKLAIENYKESGHYFGHSFVGSIPLGGRSIQKPTRKRGLFCAQAHQLLGVRPDLKGGAMFLFEVLCAERQKPRARPARKFRQEFYWKASPGGRSIQKPTRKRGLFCAQT